MYKRRTRRLLAALLVLFASGCQAARVQPQVATATEAQRVATSPVVPTPTDTPRVETFPTVRALARASGVPPQVLLLTGMAQTENAPRGTPPPGVFWTVTPDLRPTTTLDFVRPHRLTDVGVIFPGPPDDFGLVCYKVVAPPEGLLVNDYWGQLDGPVRRRVYVYAGATAKSAAHSRGSLMVAFSWDPCTWEEYISPEATGALKISDARGHILQLESETRTYYFDVDARLFVSSFPVP